MTLDHLRGRGGGTRQGHDQVLFSRGLEAVGGVQIGALVGAGSRHIDGGTIFRRGTGNADRGHDTSAKRFVRGLDSQDARALGEAVEEIGISIGPTRGEGRELEVGDSHAAPKLIRLEFVVRAVLLVHDLLILDRVGLSRHGSCMLQEGVDGRLHARGVVTILDQGAVVIQAPNLSGRRLEDNLVGTFIRTAHALLDGIHTGEGAPIDGNELDAEGLGHGE